MVAGALATGEYITRICNNEFRRSKYKWQTNGRHERPRITPKDAGLARRMRSPIASAEVPLRRPPLRDWRGSSASPGQSPGASAVANVPPGKHHTAPSHRAALPRPAADGLCFCMQHGMERSSVAGCGQVGALGNVVISSCIRASVRSSTGRLSVLKRRARTWYQIPQKSGQYVPGPAGLRLPSGQC